MLHKTKKSFGQNFLKLKSVVYTMCNAVELSSVDTVVEIGPGKGMLTSIILEKAKKVYAIEKDRDLIPLLQEKFVNEIKNGQLELIQGDILQFNPKEYNLKNYKIIANIPYNITGAILEYFLASTMQPVSMVLLVQKEVADRIVARDGKESILSMSVKVYGIPKYIMKVSRKYFSPSPHVDSAVIAISSISNKYFKTKKEESTFFTVLKAGFAHKRKVLKGNLSNLFDKNTIDAIYNDISLSPNSRAEELPLDKWLKIYSYLK